MADRILELVDDLEAAGVRATADQRTLNPPGALVALSAVVLDRLAGYSLELTVYLCAPNTGTVDALHVLDPLIPITAQVCGIGGRFEAYPLPDLSGGDPLPALRATITVPVC